MKINITTVIFAASSAALLFATDPAAFAADSPPDLTKDKVVYMIGYTALGHPMALDLPAGHQRFHPQYPERQHSAL